MRMVYGALLYTLRCDSCSAHGGRQERAALCAISGSSRTGGMANPAHEREGVLSRAAVPQRFDKWSLPRTLCWQRHVATARAAMCPSGGRCAGGTAEYGASSD